MGEKVKRSRRGLYELYRSERDKPASIALTILCASMVDLRFTPQPSKALASVSNISTTLASPTAKKIKNNEKKNQTDKACRMK